MAGHKSTKEWEELFKSADKDNNGSLSVNEVKELLKKGDSNLTDSQLNNVFEHFDGPKGDKIITLQEFITGLQKIEEFAKELEDIFIQHDADKSGYLDKNELKKILLECGQTFTDAEINDILKQADPSGDGKISFEEFINAFT